MPVSHSPKTPALDLIPFSAILYYKLIQLPMRDILNISLPAPLTREVKKAVKRGNFASVSEFLRFLVRTWLEETKLAEEVKTSEQEFIAGKGKVLGSLAELR